MGKCMKLTTILNQYAPETYYYDIFSLDVEGAELQVLESLDFSIYSFGIILIEADGSNIEREGRIRSLLSSKGYKFIKQYRRSDWFISEELYKQDHVWW